jgi:hypothetical protein
MELDSLFQPVESYWCFPKNVSFEIFGSFGIGHYSNLKLVVDICKNTTANNNSCNDLESIQKGLPVLTMHYIMSENIVDHYKSIPIVPTISSGLLKTTGFTFSRNVFWLKTIEYISDERFIMSTKNIFSSISTDTFTQESFTAPPGSKTVFSHII